ncbi:hypothetical protein [Paraburkholderia rhizosphaerae]|uniref:Phage protein D n=1 Tax=Paraburkholderia rhizosphaerae TaxID=480658 RepID=A0A4R8LTR1_9BURK|nr:hypothetical protein [Paraburkholderia rhizosphaerae]TDY50908.1 hypothetical protein BX592_108145 [Paraburkholderia rhizosphaerae]
MLNGGIHLSMLIGPAVATPAPADVMDALDAVQVTTSSQLGAFQLTFKAGRTSSLIASRVPAGFFDPIITRVILIVTVNGQPNVIMDGVVTRQELSPSNAVGQSTLTITGEDLSRMMDLVEMPFMRYPGMPISARVLLLLAKYAVLGMAPLVIPPLLPDITLPIDKIPTQSGTDLAYVKQLAEQCGFVFYIEPGPAAGSSIAYFGPDIRIPDPQPALTVDMDAASNVETLSFSLDGTAKKITVITVLDPLTGKIPIPVPVPNLSALRPPMGLRPALPAKVEFGDGTGGLSLADAANRALGIVLKANDSITGTGTLDVLRYGRVLRSRMMVGVRGAGIAYDGLYYVNSVTHSLKRGEYKQNFNLSRDGLVANVSGVSP